MIAGEQLRLIVGKLDLSLEAVERETGVPASVLLRSMDSAGSIDLTEGQESRLRAFFGRAGVLIFKPGAKRGDHGVSFMRGGND